MSEHIGLAVRAAFPRSRWRTRKERRSRRSALTSRLRSKYVARLLRLFLVLFTKLFSFCPIPFEIGVNRFKCINLALLEVPVVEFVASTGKPAPEFLLLPLH